MKVYIRENRVSIVGKPWQIKHILRQYMEEFDTVQEWIHNKHKPNNAKLRRIK